MPNHPKLYLQLRSTAKKASAVRSAKKVSAAKQKIAKRASSTAKKAVAKAKAAKAEAAAKAAARVKALKAKPCECKLKKRSSKTGRCVYTKTRAERKRYASNHGHKGSVLTCKGYEEIPCKCSLKKRNEKGNCVYEYTKQARQHMNGCTRGSYAGCGKNGTLACIKNRHRSKKN